MIQKFEKFNNSYIDFSCEKGKEETTIKKYIDEIIKIKKFPFSKVYFSIPINFLELFMEKTKKFNLKEKTIEKQLNTVYIEY